MTNRTLNALRAGYDAFRFAFAEPGEYEVLGQYEERMAQYRLGWGAYTNDCFSNLARWEGYAQANGLYPLTRGFKNPTGRLVDFYAGCVYQGVLSEDGANLPDGKPIAIPIGRDTSTALKAAIAQTWEWGNWAEEKNYWVTLAASMGDGPIEIVDDTAAGKVYQRVLPPSVVRDVEFNTRGDVVYYCLEYPYRHRTLNKSCVYRRVVDKKTIRTWTDIGEAPVDEANPYGFVPMVWARHRKIGGHFGAPAIRSWSKVERLNSKLSRIDAYLRVQSQLPQIFLGKGDATELKFDATRASEQDVMLINIAGTGAIIPFANNLDVADALADARVLIEEIEQDHPETTMYQRMTEMTSLTGPAAARLLGNVENYVQSARDRYDNEYRKLAQMMIAIGGYRYNEGRAGWSARTAAQKRFAPFGLGSYDKGDLSFTIDSRPLIAETQIDREQARLAYYQRVSAGIAAGFPVAYQLEQDGASAEEIERFKAATATPPTTASNNPGL